MFPEARREEILNHIRHAKNVTGVELSKLFNVTEETIRKDLIILHERGLIIRTFGGAIMKEEYDPSLAQRTISNLQEKMLISKKASEFVNHHDCIALDAGSTTIEMAKNLEPHSDIVVVTNSLQIINILSNIEGIVVISTGGQLRPKSMSFSGKLAEYCVSQYNLQKVFISAAGVSLNEGVMDSNEREVSFKKKLVEAAKEVTLLADYSKFTKIAHETVCPIDRIKRIITDDKADRDYLQKFCNKGIEVLIVSANDVCESMA